MRYVALHLSSSQSHIPPHRQAANIHAQHHTSPFFIFVYPAIEDNSSFFITSSRFLFAELIYTLVDPFAFSTNSSQLLRHVLADLRALCPEEGLNGVHMLCLRDSEA